MSFVGFWRVGLRPDRVWSPDGNGIAGRLAGVGAGGVRGDRLHAGESGARVGGDLDPVYEAYDVPYTLYSVFRGETKLGYVHGVNVPGRGGVIQVFLAVDPESAAIGRMFYQRMESPGGAALRNPAATGQFAGLSLADFYKHDYFAAADPGNEADRVGNLAPPAGLPEAAQPDWEATLRGVRKNLVLLDLFAFDRRHEPFYERAQAAQQEKETTP